LIGDSTGDDSLLCDLNRRAPAEKEHDEQQITPLDDLPHGTLL
jgi:hypothetical protein